jgi:Uma2 family endonuclease
VEPARFVVDPRDPRAPPQHVWDRATEAERRTIVASLPSEPERAAPPEGDVHRRSKNRAVEALEEFYRRTRRRIYLSSELPVYYPGERMFAPDLLAVLDVEPHDRQSWVVSAEGRGLDFVLEIHVAGAKRKDYEDNVERYASLGIPEYFVYEPVRGHIAGWRLGNPPARAYERIVPQAGRWPSAVLDLDLALEGGRLRFFHGSAELLDAHELVERLSRMVDEAVRRAEEEARRAEEEARRAEEEARRAEEEARRAEEEARRAEEEARRADRLADRLRELGFDPDEIG